MGQVCLTKASLSVLEGMGGAVLQEVGGLGGHALQHQVQAARVACSQGEAHDGMGGAVLQEVGGLGGHALQHQVQAARVAGSQGEAQDDHLHLIYCLGPVTSIATLPAPVILSLIHIDKKHRHVHIYWLESDSQQISGRTPMCQ